MKNKKVLIILLMILSLLAIKLIFTFTTNEIVIAGYKKEKYYDNLINILKATNFNEPYIVYYNKGNILNKEKKYDDAIINYKKALTKIPPDNRKCDIYINMTITMLQMIDAQDKQELLDQLEEARENLYNNHCADEKDNSGKSQEAENLEEDIREMENETNNDSNNEDGNENNKPKEEEETEEEKSIENQLQDINKDASAERQKENEENKNLNDYQYYSGKNW